MNIYTDGSTTPKNPGHGGAGFIAFGNQQNYVKSWYLGEEVTNNQAETNAALEAIYFAIDMNVKHVTIHTDSQYVVLGLRRLMQKREALSTHSDLWQIIEGGLKKVTLKVIFVESHSGIVGNEVADALAYIATGLVCYDEFIDKEDFDKFIETLKERKKKRREEVRREKE